eukprot:gb/GECH01001284.1/.p1 GENE.gb/GECH01001284.1/~~gb/GECH01001284.1/.p1  ORF type:complete len:577 (+),score=104.02 gb/GECH01001284.1/:1-1731(+)
MTTTTFCDGNINSALTQLCRNKAFADVIFLTEDKTEIPGHRVLLAARSAVFDSLLYGPAVENEKIPLEITLDDDVEANTFRSLLNFIYTDNVEINEETVLNLLHVSHKFSVKLLFDRCVNFIVNSNTFITPYNAATIFSRGIQYQDQRLTQIGREHIASSPRKVFSSDSFFNLPRTNLFALISSDQLAVKEIDVFNGVQKWAANECQSRDVPPDASHIRQVLTERGIDVGETLMDHIRFGNMSETELRQVRASNILKTEELSKIINFVTQKISKLDNFAYKPREKPLVKHLFSASGDQTIKSWDTNDGQLLDTLTGHTSMVFGLCEYKDTLLSTSHDKTVRMWDPKTRKCLQVMGSPHSGYVYCLTPFRDEYIASGSNDKTVKIWDPSVQSGDSVIQNLSGHAGLVSCVATDTGHSNRLVSGSDDSRIIIWDTDNAKPLTTFQKHTEGVTDLLWSGGNVISSSRDGTIRVWDPESRDFLYKFVGHRMEVSSIAQLDDNTLVSGGKDKKVCLWDLRTGRRVAELDGHNGAVLDVFTYQGNIWSSSWDKTIRKWDSTTHECLMVLEGHQNSVFSTIIM